MCVTVSPSSTASKVATPAPSAALPAAATNGIGQDAFLKLLVTQLQYQDPSQPQDSTAFVQQLATFTSLEKLTSIDTSIKTLTQILSAVGASASPTGTVGNGAATTASSATPSAASSSNATSGGAI
jgi:flagellar basal-body rod modification protein FlgD